MSLPEDILSEILSRSPVRSLSRWKSVSKHWRTLITTPHFIKRHLERAKLSNPRILFSKKSYLDTIVLHSLDYDATDDTRVNYEFPLTQSLFIVGSCNGLVCLSDNQSLIVLCNPATREYKYIPFDLLHKVPEDYTRKFVLGFGHDSVADEYKVVRFDIAYSKTNVDEDDCKVYVHTLGDARPVWRRIESPAGRIFLGKNGIYVNGVLHWLKLSPASKWSHQQQHTISSIMSFDIRKEKFGRVEIISKSPIILGEFQGRLAIHACCSSPEGTLEQIEIWLMRGHGGSVERRWTKHMLISYLHMGISRSIAPLVVQQNGSILLSQGGNTKSEKRYLYVYTPETNNIEIYNGGISMWISVHRYVESLVPLIVSNSG